MKVKICGVTHPEDAEYAASFGADYIGIIFATKSKRKVSLSLAKDIAMVSKNMGVEPVGVFSDQTAEQIVSICDKTGINTVQLHGNISRNAFTFLNGYSIIYAVSVSSKQNVVISQKQNMFSSITYLYDNSVGGLGKPFNWETFSPPKNIYWILAGGLNYQNVEKAILLLNPNGVDVATGVEFPNVTRKNPILLKKFIQKAKNSKGIK